MKSKCTLVRPYTFDDVLENDYVDENELHAYTIKAFAEEFNIGYLQADKIITRLCLYEILVDRYWEDFYKSIGGK
jgi:hypothetical protein